jgi:hypothetical protein
MICSSLRIAVLLRAHLEALSGPVRVGELFLTSFGGQGEGGGSERKFKK